MFAIGERQPPSTFSSDMPSPPVPSSPVTPGTQKPLYLCPTQMMYRNCCCTASCTFAVSVSSRSLHPCNPFSSSHIFSTRTYLRISSASGRHQLPSVVLELLTKLFTTTDETRKPRIPVLQNMGTSVRGGLQDTESGGLFEHLTRKYLVESGERNRTAVCKLAQALDPWAMMARGSMFILKPASNRAPSSDPASEMIQQTCPTSTSPGPLVHLS
ncbi:hypothetical protein EV424DRAFT_1541285 [Suillus variegatus]|nr:hypothetical protein EV424DRAFT_1541285 [Suillus variegatus]